MPFTAGQQAVILPVPEAEQVVSRWRRQLDPSAALGVPAHITVIYPWLAHSEATAEDLAALRAIFAARPPIELVFEACRRFPDALYLAPVPPDPLHRLVAAMVERWPAAPPYGGSVALGELIPHLTIAQSEQHPAALDLAERGVRDALPLRAALRDGWLMAFDGKRWHRRLGLPLSGWAQRRGE